MTTNDLTVASAEAELTYGGDLTVAQAAVLLEVSEATVVAWQNRGRLGRVDVDGADGVPLVDVRRLVESPVRAAARAAAATFDPDAPDVELTEGDVAFLR